VPNRVCTSAASALPRLLYVPSHLPPPGFQPLRSSPFVALIGPVYLSEGGERPIFGAVVEPQHANTMDTLHGGFLAALVDVATGRGTRLALGDGHPVRTVSMNLDYVAGVSVGNWVEAAVTVDHGGGRTIFTSCRVTSGDRLVARANVILTRGTPRT